MIKKPLLKTAVSQSAIAASLALGTLAISPAIFADAPEQGKQQRFVCTIDPNDKQFVCNRDESADTKESTPAEPVAVKTPVDTDEAAAAKKPVDTDETMATKEPVDTDEAMDAKEPVDTDTKSEATPAEDEQPAADEDSDKNETATPAMGNEANAASAANAANKATKASDNYSCACTPQEGDDAGFSCTCTMKNATDLATASDTTPAKEENEENKDAGIEITASDNAPAASTTKRASVPSVPMAKLITSNAPQKAHKMPAPHGKNTKMATSAEPSTRFATTPTFLTQAPKDHSKGFYVRGQLGFDWAGKSTVGADAADHYKINDKDSRGINGRLAGGYNINDYFGIEVGLGTLHDVNIDHYAGSETTPADSILKDSLFTVDALLKGTYGFGKMYVFGGVGAALVHQKVTLTKAGPSWTTAKFPDVTANLVAPKIAIGAGYNINSQLSADVEYARIFGKGDALTKDNSKYNSDFLPSTNTISVGLTYKFNNLHGIHFA